MSAIKKAALRIAMQEKVKLIQENIENKIQSYRTDLDEKNMYSSILTSKFQVTIPQAIRKDLELEPKEQVFFMPVETRFYDMKVFMMYKSEEADNYAVSTKGQITLKKEFREEFKLKAGDELLFLTEQGIHFMVIQQDNKDPYVDTELLVHLKPIYDEANFYKKSTVSIYNKTFGIKEDVLFQYVNVYEDNDLMYISYNNQIQPMKIEENESLVCKWVINQNPIAIFQEAYGYETWDLSLSVKENGLEKYRKHRKKEWKDFVKFLTEHPNLKFLVMQEPDMDKRAKNNRLVTNYGKVLELFFAELEKEGIFIHLFISPLIDSVLMLERSIVNHYGEVIRVKLNEGVEGGVEEISKITYDEYRNRYDFNAYYRGL